MFDPRCEYTVTPDKMDIKDFFEYPDMYVDRPPYQRKSVWSIRKKQNLLESLFRRYYVPKLVLREVRTADEQTVWEVVDGQQRINTVQDFFAGEVKLPKTLASLNSTLPGKTYGELSAEIRLFADKRLKYDVDLIKGIDDARSPEHQHIATEIFWRLQQGDPLNFMEIAHARLSSLVRNFIVKYADDIAFDYKSYKPLDTNPFRHKFFSIIERNNDRMQHLALLGRMLLIEKANGPAEIRDKVLGDWIDETQTSDGVGNSSYENEQYAKNALRNLNLLFEIFEGDPAIDATNGVKELRVEYFILSVYILIRHLRTYYVMDDKHKDIFRQFIYDFHARWSLHLEEDLEVQIFQNNRQQSRQDVETRNHIFRQIYFDYLKENSFEITCKDQNRTFNESQRLRVYRTQNGLCQQCLKEGKPEKEARVSWSDFEADHILPWILGGQTEETNCQVLCKAHNATKGASKF